MTGVADVYLMLRRPRSIEAKKRMSAMLQKRKKKEEQQKFVVLSWKRTGSNLLCGILHNHPEITMHNELFNPIDIFTYHPDSLLQNSESKDHRWTFLARDLWPTVFLEHIWTGCYADGSKIKKKSKTVGFKSFPDHWTDSGNENVWKEELLYDFRVKKIILHREDELAVYVSMKRAEVTGSYMSRKYPQNLKINIDIPKFQAFVNHYRFTFQRKYKSPLHERDTFHISYEQLIDEENFNTEIAPLLFQFLNVNSTVPPKRLAEVVKQSHGEPLEDVIKNFDDLEYAFMHTDVSFFASRTGSSPLSKPYTTCARQDCTAKPQVESNFLLNSWSILLPICSRGASNIHEEEYSDKKNRFSRLDAKAQHTVGNFDDPNECWKRLELFAESLLRTTTSYSRSKTECIIGIDVDDQLFNNDDSKRRIMALIPCEVHFVLIQKPMYGKVCRIWNLLAERARCDFIVLFGDDIILMDEEWQKLIERKFRDIANDTSLPYGAACVAMNDVSFEGFPTFPVVHRWHLRTFRSLLPRQFVNQGGDPYLYELYSRWNASSFVKEARLKNTVGGDSHARYLKHDVNWKGQVLSLSLQKLKGYLGPPNAACIDIVVPSYRINNSEIMKRIVSLRATRHAYVRFWIVVDNPDPLHLNDMKDLASQMNQNCYDINYYVNVIHYGENRGVSYARNIGYNYSNADWVIFLDDDVLPDKHILDAYIGSMMRYPSAKVMVGCTEMPPAFNQWTQMLRTSNIMYFYGIAKHRVHPPWGVTANLMVKGSRNNHTLQFKNLFPNSGGGEDLDFVFQMKKFHGDHECVVAVPGAKAEHPWWNRGNVCYKQICGWAIGDSLCITEWPEKTYMIFPNWTEYILFALVSGPFIVTLNPSLLFPLCQICMVITTFDHLCKIFAYYPMAAKISKTDKSTNPFILAMGASTIISSQEVTRTICAVKRMSLWSLCRRMDWFDGVASREILDAQLRSCITTTMYFLIGYYFFPSS